MTDHPDRCPVHSTDEPGHEWPCPMAHEGDPPDAETCPHFVAEIERRIEDIKGGHYFKYEKTLNGWQSQEYRNHQPYGEPKFREALFDDSEDEEE